jgi:hypothetical protein
MHEQQKIRIDVGTSCLAPNSAYWLNKYHDIIVLAFEPNPQNINSLYTGQDTEKWFDFSLQINSNSIFDKQKNKICNITDKNNKFFLYDYAIDDVFELCKKTFFCTSEQNTGCSSLNRPIESILKVSIKQQIEVNVAPLNYFLDKIDWNTFKYIEFLKTDTQSNDLNVVKSCKQYLNKICFIQSEYFTNNQYENEKNQNDCFHEFNNFMIKNNFSLYWKDGCDVRYVNNNLIDYIKNNNILDDSSDYPNGIFKF